MNMPKIQQLDLSILNFLLWALFQAEKSKLGVQQEGSERA